MDIKRLLRKELPAPLWKRIVAYFIDGVVLSIILSPLQPTDITYTSFSAFATHLTSSAFTLQFVVALVLVSLFSLLYWTLLEYRFHQTLGKYFMHLFVHSEGKTLTLSQCLLRNVAKLNAFLLLIDTLYIFFSHQPQRYSETLAKTEVIQHV